jgi:hypothetical protein
VWHGERHSARRPARSTTDGGTHLEIQEKPITLMPAASRSPSTLGKEEVGLK